MPNTQIALNRILYGPPGTGKTHHTVVGALEVLDPSFLSAHESDRPAIKARFDEFVASGHVRFVTFHQSFAYEDFVEGLRAAPNDEGNLKLEIVDGIFKSIAHAAAARTTVAASSSVNIQGRHIWKMSLGNSQGDDAQIFDECISESCILLGWGASVDYSGASSRQEVFERLHRAQPAATLDSYAVTAVTTFLLKMHPGDLVVVSEGNLQFRAIGEVTGAYDYLATREDDYRQARRVKWLRVYDPSLPFDELMNNRFSQMTLYELRPGAIDLGKLSTLLNSPGGRGAQATNTMPFTIGEKFGGYTVRHVSSDLLELEKPNGNRLPLGMSMLRELASHVQSGSLSIADIRDKRVFQRLSDTWLEPFLVNGYNNVLPGLVERIAAALGSETPGAVHRDVDAVQARVLIIDEINRGNVARIFGELITLIEPSKRKGADEALEVTLPYSKQRFSVPQNVYLIGTMNTADRSLATLDIALRRRFEFKEMPPRPELLDDIVIEGLGMGHLLRVVNQRIEALLDRDHCLGHTYFLPLRENRTLGALARVFEGQVLPLLQEYFFEDWERIRWVLNDHRKPVDSQFIRARTFVTTDIFGADVPGLGKVNAQWELAPSVFQRIDAYQGIIQVEL
jgi:5-methylcytosine-specific restriction enzyme B